MTSIHIVLKCILITSFKKHVSSGRLAFENTVANYDVMSLCIITLEPNVTSLCDVLEYFKLTSSQVFDFFVNTLSSVNFSCLLLFNNNTCICVYNGPFACGSNICFIYISRGQCSIVSCISRYRSCFPACVCSKLWLLQRQPYCTILHFA